MLGKRQTHPSNLTWGGDLRTLIHKHTQVNQPGWDTDSLVCVCNSQVPNPEKSTKLLYWVYEIS